MLYLQQRGAGACAVDRGRSVARFSEPESLGNLFEGIDAGVADQALGFDLRGLPGGPRRGEELHRRVRDAEHLVPPAVGRVRLEPALAFHDLDIAAEGRLLQLQEPAD